MDYKVGTMKSLIYKLLRVSNDLNAVKRGKVGKRVKRRLLGKMFNRLVRW